MRWKLAFYLGMMVVISAIIFWTVALSIMTREARKITFSQENANQISIGMTRDEVETILGCPPGDYTTELCDTPPYGPWTFVCDWWVSDTGEIGVWFDEGEKVKKVVFRLIQRSSHPFWYEILTRLQSLGGSNRPPKIEPRPATPQWADFVRANGGRVERKKEGATKTQGVINCEPTIACR
jgi:hypothetical protein